MAKPSEPYQYVVVESYLPNRRSGLHGPVHIRPVAGQGFPTIMHVECSKELSNTNRYPLGTQFRLRAKLTDLKGGGEFLYSSWRWKYEVLGQAPAAR
ncbi:MAG: hypothetical protein GC149_19290 [Gammaproteobacteria bacterium]|nr:hypothetical protein [Gammaproteobacteria bacterium]